MPLYTYRREDGTTFDIQQKFLDDPLSIDPSTGQKVVRVIQATGIIFKGSGFYVNDSKSGARNAATSPVKTKEGETTATESKGSKTEGAKSDGASTSGGDTTAKTEPSVAKTESKAAAD